MHRTEPTTQQNLALQLSEKLGSLVENNERVFDQKQGTYGGYFRDQKDGYRKNEGGYMRRGGYRQQEPPETASKKPQSSYNSLNLDDGKVFRLKTKWELTRGLLVFFLCSSPWLVQKAPKLLSVTRRILGSRLWSSALRLTFYGQFVAGETHKEIKETLQRLQHLGVWPLLAVPIEEDVGEEKEGTLRMAFRHLFFFGWEGCYDKNAQSMITCLDLSVGGAPNPMMQLKVTALMAAELCVSTVGCTKQYLWGTPN
ncbi:putative proline dehydrogenase 2 [Crotalus adamanteus]|uniref:Proline dehydrogenase n=1 Tax=Crotalus adamanteus TaxID=8729 RepID=A0AAW1B0D4_CROAD